MRWWDLFLALRVVVIGAPLIVMGAFLTYLAWDDDPELVVVGVIIFVAGLGLLVLGVVLWPRGSGAGEDAAPDPAADVGARSS